METKRRLWGANLKFDLQSEIKATALSLLSYIFVMLFCLILNVYFTSLEMTLRYMALMTPSSVSLLNVLFSIWGLQMS